MHKNNSENVGRTKEPGACLKARGGEGQRGEAQSETGRERGVTQGEEREWEGRMGEEG